VVLDFRGTLSNIQSIAVDLDLSGQKQSAVLTAPGGASFALPIDATLQIQHGSGLLSVTATAKSAQQGVLGIGTNSDTVTAGQAKHITVQFGSNGGDGGIIGGIDGPTDLSGDVPPTGVGPDGNGGVGGLGGSAGAGGFRDGGGAAGNSGAGGNAQDAGFGGTNGGGTGASTLTGGSPTALTLQPTLPAFGVVDVGSSVDVTFTVSNTGSSSVSGLLVSNSSGPAFRIGSDQCSNRLLASSTSCTFAVTFAPTAAGPASGNVTVTSPGAAISLTASLSGTGRQYVTLTVKLSGAGSGTVTGAGLTCASGMCTGQYARTDPAIPPNVALTATPGPLSTFGGWTDAGGCAAANTCTLVLSSNTNVTVTFSTTAPMVQVGRNAIGLAGHTGSIIATDSNLNCSTLCAPVPYPAGSYITLSANPNIGSTFVGWADGPCSGASPQCTFQLNSDVIVSATFGPQTYMFVTSTSVIPGKLLGLAGADAECASRALMAHLPGTYRAWLDSSAGPGSSRVGGGGWVRVDGRPFARNIATLAAAGNQVVFYPPRIDEAGTDVGPAHVLVATGSNSASSAAGGYCNDYTYNYSGSGTLSVGDAIAGSGSWAYSQDRDNGCSTSLRLYCFRTDLQPVDITPPVLQGRHVFVTASAWTPSGSITSADAFCRADAKAANLNNASTFIALLGTSTTSAAMRLNTGGAAWKRADDVFVFNSPTDLATNRLLAPFDLPADGSLYVSYSFWSGATGPGSASSGDVSCQDWTSSSVLAHGLYGNTNLSGGPDWFADSAKTFTCDQAGVHLLCAEP
jgi:hypothetical protein